MDPAGYTVFTVVAMGVEFKDYYRILGVDRKADEKTIKSAYRKLARKHHPDVALAPALARPSPRRAPVVDFARAARPACPDADRRSGRFGGPWVLTGPPILRHCRQNL